MTTVLPLLLALPVLIALIGACLAGRHRAEPARRAVAMALTSQWLTFAASVALAAWVLVAGPMTGSLLAIDRLSAVLIVLTSGISLTVHTYARRYMDGDAAAGRFFRDIGLLSATILLMLTAADILILAAAWLAASVVLANLLRHRRGWPAAEAASRRTLLFLLVGDVAFLVAAALAVIGFGTTHIASVVALAAAEAGQPLAIGIGLLLIVAALAKSAQVPLHGWLPDSMTAPTPVSALMHAGFVNAGGYLLARFAEMYMAMPEVLAIAFWIGAASALLGSAAMLVQPDIKRALAYSTIGQMGFMIMQCGLGAFAAAIYHVLVHAVFKATLFLGAGSVIQTARIQRELSAGTTGGKAAPVRVVLAGSLALVLAIGLFVALYGTGASATSMLLGCFAVLAMAQVVLVGVRLPNLGAAGAVATAAAATLVFATYLGGLALTQALLAPDVVNAAQIPAAAVWLVPAVFAAAFLIAAMRPDGRAIASLRDWLYVRLLFLGQRRRGADPFSHRTDPA